MSVDRGARDELAAADPALPSPLEGEGEGGGRRATDD